MTVPVSLSKPRVTALRCKRCAGTGKRGDLPCLDCGCTGTVYREVEIKEDRQNRMRMVRRVFNEKRIMRRRETMEILREADRLGWRTHGLSAAIRNC